MNIVHAYHLAGTLIPLLPASLAYHLAGWSGRLLYHRPSRSRATLQANLRRLLGPGATATTIDQIGKQVFANVARNYVDLFRLPRITPDEIKRRVHVRGWEHVEAAVARGKGIIFTSGHVGNIDLVAQYIVAQGIPVVGVMERIQPTVLYDYVSSLRMSQGLQFIPTGGSLKPVLKALRANQCVGLACDHDVTGSGRLVPFLGGMTRMPDGHVTLAMRTGATIIVGFSRRRPDNHFDSYVEPPLVVPTDCRDPVQFEAEVQARTEWIVARFEAFLRANPEQWIYLQPLPC